MLLREAAERLGRRVSVVASGDLSHRLTREGPYGFAAEGPDYDARIMDVMGRAAFGELFAFSDALCSRAGECGHRSFTIMAGCFDGQAVTGRALSHEGPFGVGYGVCLFTPGDPDTSRRFLAAAQAGGLAPDDGSDPWLPFSLAVGVDSCMSEETACGATRRTAVELRRAGGAPRQVFDAQWAVVGDRGEAQLWVAAAQLGDEACVGAAGAWFAVGLLAAR